MSHKIWQLLLPPAPVMVDIKAPVVYPGRDLFLLQHGIHPPGRGQQVVDSLSYAENNLAVLVQRQIYPNYDR